MIVPSALTDYVPLQPAVKQLSGEPELAVPVIQFEKDGAEDAGLVKIDLLGNRSLDKTKLHMKAVRITVRERQYDLYPERINTN